MPQPLEGGRLRSFSAALTCSFAREGPRRPLTWPPPICRGVPAGLRLSTGTRDGPLIASLLAAEPIVGQSHVVTRTLKIVVCNARLALDADGYDMPTDAVIPDRRSTRGPRDPQRAIPLRNEYVPVTMERVMDISDIASELLTDERWAAQQVIRQHGQGAGCKHCDVRGCPMLAWARGVLGGGARVAYPQVESVSDAF